MGDAIITQADRSTPLKNLFLNKKAWLALLAVVLIAIAWYVTTSKNKNQDADYLTDAVRRGDLAVTISATGTVEPITRVSLAFKNAEIINDIYVKVGDSVTPGQLLAEQDTSNLEASLVQATASLKGNEARLELLRNGATAEELMRSEIDVSTAEASFEQTKIKLDNYQMLYQEGAISKTEFDSVNLEYITAEGRLKQAEYSLASLKAGNRIEDIEAAAAQVESSNAQLRQSQNDLTGAKMYSPIAGIVSAVNGAVGQRATANNNNVSGGGFIDIISEEMQVKAQVNEADIGNAAIGQPVEFTVNSFPNRTFAGSLESIAPEAYNQSNIQIYDIVIQMDRHYPELKAGMPCDVTIIAARSNGALTVPKSAVTFATSYMAQTGAQMAENRGASGQGRIPQGTDANLGASVDETVASANADITEDDAPTEDFAPPEGFARPEEGAMPPEGFTRPEGNAPRDGTGRPDRSDGAGWTENPGAASGVGNQPQNAPTFSSDRDESSPYLADGQDIQPAMVIVMESDGKLTPKRVILGLSDLSRYEVLDGLQEGETVVTGGGGIDTGGGRNTGGNQNFGPGGGGVMIRPGGGMGGGG